MTQLMECESNLKKIDVSLLFRKHDIDIHKSMATDDYDMKSLSKLDELEALQVVDHNQKLHFSGVKRELDLKVEENENKIKRIETDLKEQIGADDCETQTRNRKAEPMPFPKM